MRDVEQKSSRSVGDINGGLAGQAEANVVLRQHDLADALPVFRFVLADPKEFGKCEIGERRVAGQLNEAVQADGAFEFFALGFGALIAPNQRRADDFVVIAQKYGAVHLAGKTDGGDGFGGEAGSLERFADGERGCAPPVARILFGPAWLRACKNGVLFRAGGENGAVVVEDDGAGTACSNINAEDCDGPS